MPSITMRAFRLVALVAALLAPAAAPAQLTLPALELEWPGGRAIVEPTYANVIGYVAIADLEGDGRPEIGTARIEGNADTSLNLYAPDGRLLWSVPFVDHSYPSATAADLDGDCVPEVLVGGEQAVKLVAGPTGAVLWEDPATSSTTLDQVSVADVDGDGSLELVKVMNLYVDQPGGQSGIRVYGAPDWSGGRPVWNQHPYHVTNVDDGGSVPRFEAESWTLYNHYHAQGPRFRAAVVPVGNSLLAVKSGPDVRLRWSPPAGATAHEVARDVLKGTTTAWRTVAAPSLLDVDAVPPPPALYFYQVSGRGCGP